MRPLFSPSLVLPVVLAACGGSVSPGGGGGGVDGGADGGGDADVVVDCATEKPAPIAYACLADLGKGGGGGTEPVTMHVEGTITDVRHGAAADGCIADQLDTLRTRGEIDHAHTIHFRGADGRETTVGLVMPGPADGLAVFASTGAKLIVDARHLFGGWSPSEDEVTVTSIDATGSHLVAYYGRAGTLDALKAVPSGMTLSVGAKTCVAHSECGDWAGYRLEAKNAKDAASIRAGQNVPVRPFSVFNAGILRETPSDVPRCADWFVASVGVMIVPYFEPL